jgi:hypothetical protein
LALLRPKTQRKRTRLRSYITISCPYNGHQVSWCRGLCEPIDGHGFCRRVAPHCLTGRTQAAIASYKERTREAESEG